LSLLGEASETRAETLVTSCPKCLAHLKCATETPAGSSMRHMRIVDLATYVAERMKAVEPAAGTKNAEEDFLSSEVRI
jgi:Fe-S oxidoreductase